MTQGRQLGPISLITISTPNSIHLFLALLRNYLSKGRNRLRLLFLHYLTKRTNGSILGWGFPLLHTLNHLNLIRPATRLPLFLVHSATTPLCLNYLHTFYNLLRTIYNQIAIQ
ncbi:hypothetical protein Droror1_Dr00025172 [Drosera rotundifolia]